MTMLHEDKPSLEEALEHYGVIGMKWGVRRDEAELAKARIKRKGGTPSRGGGKRSAWNARRTGSEISKARVAVKNQKKKISAAAKDVADARSPAEEAAAQKKLQAETRKLLKDNQYPISAQMTIGEAFWTGFFGTPMTAVVAFSAAQANSQRRANVRRNLIEEDFLKNRSYSSIEKESARFIEKEARKK